jgi:hypothetical protein
MSASQVRFDAYTATTQAVNVQGALGLIYCAGDTLHEGRGFHTFRERVAVKDRFGFEVGSVSSGGAQDRVMIEVKGERTPFVVGRLRAEAEQHRCTRVDSCVDVERPGAFEDLLTAVSRVKSDHRLYGERRGDWEFPEKGRTQYLGANSSPIRARLYEKGKQPELAHLERWDLCRLEIQVRPQKEAKADFARLSAVEVWGASKWTRQLAGSVLGLLLDPHPPGTVRRDSQRERALRWMTAQYGVHLVSLAQDLGGWDVLGLTLGEMVTEERERRARMPSRGS